jgi:protein phosphatase
VHGCFDELVALLGKLGYSVAAEGGRWRVTPPAARKAVFVGDLVDRGPGIAEVLALVMDMVAEGSALCVPGNHEMKLLRKLRGRDVAHHARARRVAGAARAAAAAVQRARRGVHRRARQPLRPR